MWFTTLPFKQSHVLPFLNSNSKNREQSSQICIQRDKEAQMSTSLSNCPTYQKAHTKHIPYFHPNVPS